MPEENFFSNLGLYTNSGFLNPDNCKSLISDLKNLNSHQSQIVRKSESFIDKEIRKTKYIIASNEVSLIVKEKLLTLIPDLNAYFNTDINSCDEPQFLCYKKGDFFNAHQDSGDEPDDPDFIKERKISVVIFLNSESKTPKRNYYCGGSLIFYGLIQDPRTINYGFPLEGKSGLLIAFPSNILHEVNLVTYGSRYTIVTWFI